VELTDDVNDVRHVLSALYDGFNPKYFYTKEPLLFSVVAAMLRFGTKYNVHRIREEAVRCLESSFPSTLEAMDEVGITKNTTTCTYRSIDIEAEENLMDLISLAHECDVPSILPAVFYAIVTLDVDQLVDGMADKRWSRSDLAACLKGITHLRKAETRQSQRLLLHARAESCSTAVPCRRAFKAILSTFIAEQGMDIASAHCLIPGRDGWIPSTAKKNGLCASCTIKFADDYEKEREATWGQMKSYFGIEK